MSDNGLYSPTPVDEDTAPSHSRSAKRARTIIDEAQSVEHSSKLRAGNPRAKGKLAMLPSLPLDILYEIFKLLIPSDILHLSRTTKSLRAVLLHRSSTTVWSETLKRIDNFPACPDDMSLPAWASLIFDTYCHHCLAKYTDSVNFILRVRCCTKCSKKILVPLCNYPKMRQIIEKAVPTDHFNGSADLRAHKSQVEAFLKRWKTRTQLGDRLTEERAMVARHKQIGLKAKEWYDKRTEDRSEEIHALRTERADAIKSKLIEMGFAPEVAFLLRFYELCVLDPLPKDMTFYMDPHVRQAKPLTERIWQNMSQDMTQLMCTVQAYKEQNDTVLLRRKRRNVVRDLYLWWRNEDKTLEEYPANEFMPSPVDIMDDQAMIYYFHFTSECDIDEWKREVRLYFDSHLKWMVDYWRNSVLDTLLKMVIPHIPTLVPNTLEFYTDVKLSQAHVDPRLWLYDTSIAAKKEQLALATVVFRCTSTPPSKYHDYGVSLHKIVDGAYARDEGCGDFDADHGNPSNGYWRRDNGYPLDRREPLFWFPEVLSHPCAGLRLHRGPHNSWQASQASNPSAISDSYLYHIENSSRKPQPEDWSSQSSTHGYSGSTLGRGGGVYQTAWCGPDASACWEFDECASRATLGILQACDLSRLTTAQDLDSRDARFICLKCSPESHLQAGRQGRVWGWREAVNHAVNTHKDDVENGTLIWRRLSSWKLTAEAKRLEAAESNRLGYPNAQTEKVWRCTACRHTVSDPGRMTWSELNAHWHIAQNRNQQNQHADLNKRFYKDPEVTRRFLPRIYMEVTDS